MLFFMAARKKSRPSLAPKARGTLLRLEELESRLVPYAVSGNAWPNPALITISFEPDGTVLGTNSSGGNITSNLVGTLNNKLGGPQPGQQFAAWQVQIIKAAQAWAQQSNFNLEVVADNGAAAGSGSYQQGDLNFGDIRIGGYAMGTSGPLAQAYQPPPVNNYSIAGDITFNTSQSFHIGSTYDLFTVAAHEFGHALGLDHSTKTAAEMYASYNATKPTLNADDISAIQSVYGGARAQDLYDTVASNGTFATATDLTALPLNLQTLVGQVVKLDITTTSDVDFYKVAAPLLTNSTATITIQSTGLSLLSPKLTVYAADQTTVLGTATGSGQNGATLTVTLNSVTALQTFYVKVQAADSTPFGTGSYGLLVNFGTGTTPTIPSPNTQSSNGNPLQSGGGEAEGKDDFPSIPKPAANVPGPAAVHLLGVNFVGAAGLLPLSAPTLTPFGLGSESPSAGSVHANDNAFLTIPTPGQAATPSGGNDYFWLGHGHTSHPLPGPNVNDAADEGGLSQEDLDPT